MLPGVHGGLLCVFWWRLTDRCVVLLIVGEGGTCWKAAFYERGMLIFLHGCDRCRCPQLNIKLGFLLLRSFGLIGGFLMSHSWRADYTKQDLAGQTPRDAALDQGMAAKALQELLPPSPG